MPKEWTCDVCEPATGIVIIIIIIIIIYLFIYLFIYLGVCVLVQAFTSNNLCWHHIMELWGKIMWLFNFVCIYYVIV